MNPSTDPESLNPQLAELVELQRIVAIQQANHTRLEAALTRQRYLGLALVLAVVLMLVVGGFWSGPLQAQAQTSPRSFPKPKIISSTLSATLPKFCAGCNRSITVFPITLDLQYAYLVGANYSGSTMNKADLSGSTITYAHFDGALMNQVNFFASYGPFTFFNDALLSDSNLLAANFDGADFTNADLTGAHGTPSVSTAIWSNTTCPDATISNTHGNTCNGHFIP